jgi:hypothetical protein
VSIKFKVKIGLVLALVMLAILPIYNLSQSYSSEYFKFDRATLFNIDKLIVPFQRMVYSLGISLNAKQVYIGQDGWIYLGDQYASTVSTRRTGLTESEKKRAIRLNEGLVLWDQFLKSKGVKAFFIMMGPDKATIYPEYLPNWANATQLTRTDALFYKGSSGLIFDTRIPLLLTKHDFDHRIYYKTDTHWNDLGAWIAFQAFISSMAEKDMIEGQWLNDAQVQLVQTNNRAGGDLSNFLRLRNHLADEEPLLKIDIGVDINVEQIEFKTGEKKSSGGNPRIGSPPIAPLLVRNDNALNDRKVLWLRDSFGTAASPYMSATFSNVLQIHYHHVNTQVMLELVEEFEPDYVFITAVERQLATLNIGLRDQPPQFSFLKSHHMTNSVASSFSGLNHLEEKDGHYSVTDKRDPFVVFSLEDAVKTKDYTKVGFNLECANELKEVNIQLFWHKEGAPYFNEKNSLRFKASTGEIILNLSANKIWREAEAITRLRVDLDSGEKCGLFSLTPPKLGY